MRKKDDITDAGPALTKLRTISPRSAIFFVAILLGPLAFVLPFARPGNIWAWTITVAGLVAMADCFRLLYTAYFISARGLARRRVLACDELLWSEVEAVGTRVIQERGFTGMIVSVYSADRWMRLSLNLDDGRDFQNRLARDCPHALWIDEDRGMFDVPAGGDSERVRRLVARHARRLRRRHGMAAAALLAVFVPLAVVMAYRGASVAGDWRGIGVSVLAYALLSGSHWAAMWRLRR